MKIFLSKHSNFFLRYHSGFGFGKYFGFIFQSNNSTETLLPFALGIDCPNIDCSCSHLNKSNFF